MSRHLVRLERAGLVERRKEGRTNAWRLTGRGVEVAQALYGAAAHQSFDSAGVTRRDEAASPRPHTRTVSMADPGDSPKSNRKRIR